MLDIQSQMIWTGRWHRAHGKWWGRKFRIRRQLQEEKVMMRIMVMDMMEGVGEEKSETFGGSN